MYKDEMIEEMAKVLCDKDRRCEECISRLLLPCGYKSYCTRLYNAGYRKVGDDEIVIKKRKYEELLKSILLIDIEQETAKTILSGIYNRLRYATFQQTTALRNVEDLANELGIELQNTTYSEENNDD